MKKLLLFITPLLCSIDLYSQTDSTKVVSTKQISVLPDDPASSNQLFPFLNVVPPSPEAASLGKFGDIPVSLANGTTSFDIPIYEIVSGKIRVPIKLAYHSVGIKVNDISSVVGTGWALQAGGAISRTMKGGLWDECSYGFLNTTIPEQTDNSNFMCFLGNLNKTVDYVDGSPDDFFYNFNNYSGKFLFHNRNLSNQNISPVPITYPFAPLKIEFPSQQFFKITDSDGNIYKFENLESSILTQSGRTNPCGNTFTSAWFLSQIISSNRIDTVSFVYSSNVGINGSPIWSTTLSKEVNSYVNKQFTYNYAFQRSDISSIFLSEIVYKNGKVGFEYENDRQDISDADAKRLKRIKIYHRNGSSSYEEIKHFDLVQSYFSCSDGRSQVDQPLLNVTGHTGSPLLKRLKLNTVTEYDINSVALPPYIFDYFENQPLPIYGALAQDYWGYSNGASANTNLLLWNTDINHIEEPGSLYGANCSPDNSYAISGLLKKITYPTRGNSEFVYEPNLFHNGVSNVNGGGFRIKQIINDDLINSKTTREFDYINSYVTNAIFDGTVSDNAYNFTTEVNAEDAGNNTVNCVTHFITNYPEKVNVSLGSEATFLANEEVEEYQKDLSGNRIGKKRYKYTTSLDQSFAEFPLERISSSWKRGLLLNEKTYSILPNTSEVLIQEDQITYTEVSQPFKTRGYITRLSYDNDYYSGFCQITGATYCGKFSVYNQHVFAEINEQSSVLLPTLSQTDIFDFNGSNPVRLTSNFEYNTTTLQKTKQIDYRSDGTQIENINRYPHDFVSDAVYSEMINRHIFSPVIETEIKEGSTTLKKTRTNYKQWYPSTSFGGVNGFYEPYSVETSENSSSYETEVVMGEQLVSPTQNGYDIRARPVLYTTRKNVPTTLEWWDTVGKKDFLKKKSFLYLNQNFDYTKGQLTSNIDQNGVANYHSYDTFNRLKNTKDRDFNFLQSLEYHYATNVNDRSYIKQSSFRIATTNETDGSDAQKAVINYNYIDGLGDSFETVGFKQSPLEKDIVSNVQKQDGFGRLITKILPTPTNSVTGGFQTYSDILNLAKSFYGDNAPLDSIVYEKSLLNRPQAQFGVGQAWYTADKKNQIFYESAGSDVRYYTVNNANSVILNGFYPANSLFKKRIIDEQGNTSIEITDKQGRLIQKQIQKDSIGGFLTTYYCYDGQDRVRAILQPNAYNLNQTIGATDQAHRDFVFAFEYDNRGRIIREDIPGAEERYSVYDKADKLVMKKNALQSESGNWNFWKYDAFDREVMRGETGNVGFNQSYWASLFASHTPINEKWGSGGYDGLSFPTAVSAGFNEIQMYTFYDQYDFVSALNTNLVFDAGNAYHARHTSAVGLQTGTVAYNQADHNQYFMTAQYYDTKNRPIQSFETHLLSPTLPNRTDIQYNFAGDILQNRMIHKQVGKPDIIELSENEYDHVGRLLKTFHTLNGTKMEIARLGYDQVGRLLQKKIKAGYAYKSGISDFIIRNSPPPTNTQDFVRRYVLLNPGFKVAPDTLSSNPETYLAYIDTLNTNFGTTDALQTIDYQYNVRNGLRCINCEGNDVNMLNVLQNDLFAMKLDFHETSNLFDGNIAKQTWLKATDKVKREYNYSYDPSKRLTAALFQSTNNENFSLPNISYDDNGNILNLQRKANKSGSYGLVDSLVYTYSGNRLMKVEDGISDTLINYFNNRNTIGNDFEYYSNGNLKKDLNENIINISYNTYLNQSIEITKLDEKWIRNIYSGDGKLIKRTNSSGENFIYAGNIIYRNDTIFQIGISEGRIVLDTLGNPKYQFEYRDLTGNLRLSFEDPTIGNPSERMAPEIVQSQDYEPFGVSYNEYIKNENEKNRFGYSNHEFTSDFGFNRIDFGFRTYNPTYGRFDKVDNLASHPNQNNYSPYSSFWNNPVFYTDIDGNCPSCPQGEDAAKVYSKGAEVSNKDGAWLWTGSEWKDLPNLKKHENSTSENWSEGNIAQQVGYGFVDGIYSMFADKHLNGYAFDSYDDKMSTKVSGLLTFLGPILNEIPTGAKIVQTSILSRSVGAARSGFSKTLQTGGHTLSNSTLKALGLTKEQGKIAIEGLKRAEKLPNNFHGKIMGNGDLVNPRSNDIVGNLFDYLK